MSIPKPDFVSSYVNTNIKSAIYTIYKIYKGIKEPVIVEDFKKYVKKYLGLVILLIILIATDYEYLTILKDIPMFTKRNIPQIIIQVFYYNEFNHNRLLEYDIVPLLLLVTSSKRKQSYTSPTWCQRYNPQDATEGWTSENKNIDEYIKKCQLNVTEYEKMVKWIQYSRLINLRKVKEDESK
ncbi:hypothetical protein C2G38_2201976 [Gigaspora rosea]|uniref:Uncharacterized protein n=1 Tax=Gigaspora rosea TaxID=44941 RepID=A0A397UWV2_9GLOM|nr:hypothetical protein C2G38_2201976 [Gigaspora rosea]